MVLPKVFLKCDLLVGCAFHKQHSFCFSGFVRDENIPTSIYSIEGAHEVAFETSSFSKLIGFTGVRLGWTVCPSKLRYDDGTPVRKDWAR